VEHMVDFGNLPRTDRLLLCDAQTSGGLLIAVPAVESTEFLNQLHSKGINDAVIIGKFTKIGTGRISVIL